MPDSWPDSHGASPETSRSPLNAASESQSFPRNRSSSPMRQSTPSARAARLAMALASGPSACALIYAANYQLCEALRLCRYFRALLRRAVSRGIGTALAPLGLKNGIDSLKKPATQLTRTRSRQRWPGKRPWRQRSTPSRRRKISSVYVVLSFESSSCGRARLWGNLPVRRRRRLGHLHSMRREVRPRRRLLIRRVRLGRPARAQ